MHCQEFLASERGIKPLLLIAADGYEFFDSVAGAAGFTAKAAAARTSVRGGDALPAALQIFFIGRMTHDSRSCLHLGVILSGATTDYSRFLIPSRCHSTWRNAQRQNIRHLSARIQQSEFKATRILPLAEPNNSVARME